MASCLMFTIFFHSGSSKALEEIARPIASRAKAPKEELETAILDLCAVTPLRLEDLERLLNRSAEFLRKRYIQPLIKARRLKRRYPTSPNHPQQAYITESRHDDE